jgi:prepilin-type N-terminal cleavage/methylation domain-containing protein
MELRSGFTLLEVMITTTILATVMFLTSQSIQNGTRLNERITLQTDLNNQANAVLNALALELRTVSDDTTLLKVEPSPVSTSATQTVYQYYTSQGIQSYTLADGTTSWSTQYESAPGRILTYNKTAGTLTKTYGGTDLLLCDKIAPNGFLLEQVGPTLRINLTLRTVYRAGYIDEMIIHAADAQVIFLRSTLNKTPGSHPTVTADDPTLLYVGANTSSPAPSISFGAKMTNLPGSTVTAPISQITIVIAPPIGKTLNSSATTVSIGTQVTVSATTTSYSVATVEGSAVSATTSGPTVSITRATRPTTNGTQTITLTGRIDYPITISCTAKNTANDTITESKSY